MGIVRYDLKMGVIRRLPRHILFWIPVLYWIILPWIWHVRQPYAELFMGNNGMDRNGRFTDIPVGWTMFWLSFLLAHVGALDKEKRNNGYLTLVLSHSRTKWWIGKMIQGSISSVFFAGITAVMAGIHLDFGGILVLAALTLGLLLDYTEYVTNQIIAIIGGMALILLTIFIRTPLYFMNITMYQRWQLYTNREWTTGIIIIVGILTGTTLVGIKNVRKFEW